MHWLVPSVGDSGTGLLGYSGHRRRSKRVELQQHGCATLIRVASRSGRSGHLLYPCQMPGAGGRGRLRILRGSACAVLQAPACIHSLSSSSHPNPSLPTEVTRSSPHLGAPWVHFNTPASQRTPAPWRLDQFGQRDHTTPTAAAQCRFHKTATAAAGARQNAQSP